MAEPIPMIEVGDVVVVVQSCKGRVPWLAEIPVLNSADVKYLSRIAAEGSRVQELRKSDGRIWRREEPQR